jgi:hypothetical protein
MNKLLVITSSLLAASCAMAEFSTPAFNIDAKVEFNSAGIYEGRRRLDQNFAPNIELGVPFLDDAASLYAGFGATLGVGCGHSCGRNEVTPYVGVSYDLADLFTVDLGYTVHCSGKKPFLGTDASDTESFFRKFFVPLNAEGNAERVDQNGATVAVSLDDANKALQEEMQKAGYTADQTGKVVDSKGNDANGLGLIGNWLNGNKVATNLTGKKQFHEIYAGVMVDVLFNPALYFSYDFTQRKFDINGAAHYTFDLGPVGITGLGIDLGAKIGYARAKKPYGIAGGTQVFVPLGITDKGLAGGVMDLFEKKSWFYTGLNADLVYSLNENAKARAGVAFSVNNAKKESWINEKNHKKHNVWFSTAIEFSF